MLKAIETVYDGYRFRSRLEARWAVFFKTLGIKYEYEKEGYDLDGLYYLPDFWLPEQQCWIEIKSQEPNKEERKKARLLSLESGRRVYIFPGDVRVPDVKDDIDKDGYPIQFAWEKNAYLYDTSDLLLIANNVESSCYSNKCEHGDECLNHIEFEHEHELARVLCRAEESLDLGDRSNLIITYDALPQCCASLPVDPIEFYIPTFTDRGGYIKHVLAPLPPLIEQHRQDLLRLCPDREGKWEFFVTHWGEWAGHITGHVWLECDNCGDLSIGKGSQCCVCEACYEGTLLHDTPNLIAAYIAARQARFEHGERG